MRSTPSRPGRSPRPANLPRVVVAGDICLDVLGVPMPRPGNSTASLPNWRLTGETRTHHLRGGALLLAQWVANACSNQQVAGLGIPRSDAPAASPGPDFCLPDDELPTLKRQDVVHSILEGMVDKGKGGEVVRLARAHGFSGPEAGDPRCSPVLLGDDAAIPLVVLDDTGNSFRHRRDLWPAALSSRKLKPWVVYKLHRPLPLNREAKPSHGAENPLWDDVQRHHGDRLIVVVEAEDLRYAGASVSRGLSWERTALDLVHELAGNATFGPLQGCRHLVVRLGLDGAVYRHNSGAHRLPEAWLVYDPQGIEGGYLHTHIGEHHGGMVGFGSAFVAALVGSLAATDNLDTAMEPAKDSAEPPPVMVEGIRRGLGASRRLLDIGFGKLPAPAYPGAELFAGPVVTGFPVVQIPSVSISQGDHESWTILDTLLPSGGAALEVAMELVREGRAPALESTPLGVFHHLRTYDRIEIETYRAISHLLREYLAQPTAKRPLSLAVFGPPGSGKSFAVGEVAESVRGKTVIEALTFNVSQFGDPEELAGALHLVRDRSLRGVVPLVFFDEFDATLHGQPLGWLRYFLAPMQDGEFVDRGAVHPIGKAVFIFAGGTASTYEAFCRKEPVPPSQPGKTRKQGQKQPPNDDGSMAAFRDCKGPDFISRLRGHINIPDIAHDRLPGAASVLLRRALMLRFALNSKAAAFSDPSGRIAIDTGVLRAFLQVSHLRHGVRSLAAVLDMSSFTGRPCLDPSCLPAPNQLEMHAPATEFLTWIRHPSPFGPEEDRLARAIHEAFLEERRRDRTYDPKKSTHRPWDKLQEAWKDSNRGQANQIPSQLRSIGLTFERKASGRRRGVHLSGAQIEQLARQEHERWLAEKRRAGWVYGTPRDDHRRIQDCLLPWEQLGAAQEKDRQAVRAIPRYLAAAGYQMVAI